MTHNPKSRNLLSERALRELAGERYFERGLAYFNHGAVTSLRGEGTGFAARVEGSDVYAVRIWREGPALEWGCSCPLGRDREFCKHLVAAGLVWLSGDTPDEEASDEDQPFREELQMLDKEQLIDIIAERAEYDEGWREEVWLRTRALKAARAQGASKKRGGAGSK